MSDLAGALRLAARVDETVREVATEEVLTISAVALAGHKVAAPGPGRLVEDFWLARRTFANLQTMMAITDNSKGSAGDLTESAAILTRRLVDLYAQVIWLVDYEPEGFDPPAPVGELDELLVAAQDVDWSGQDPTLYCGYLACATTWMDVQALRSDLYSLRENARLASAIAEMSASGEKKEELAVIYAQGQLTRWRLAQMGAPKTPRHDTVSILKTKTDVQTVISFRMESDVAHGGIVGRQMQRGRPGQPMLGAASEPWRRLMVVQVSTAILLQLASTAIDALGGETSQLGPLAEEYAASVI